MDAIIRKACARLHVLALLFATIFALTGVARALTYASGWIWKGDVNTPDGCRGAYLQASIGDDFGGPWNTAEVDLRECWPNAPFANVQPGWLGVAYSGYKDGFMCGSVGYYYNDVSTYGVYKFGGYCTNTSGLQTYRTVTHAKVWNGSSYSTFSQTSPDMGL